MKAKTCKKVFFLAFTLLCAALFTVCSNGTEPSLSGKQALLNQRSARTHMLSEMTEQECLKFIVKNGIAVPEKYANVPEFSAFV